MYVKKRFHILITQCEVSEFNKLKFLILLKAQYSISGFTVYHN